MEKNQKQEKKPPSTGIRILTIDGGGMRGILALRILMALEFYLGSSILDHVDLICGTSIGGIIAMYMLYKKALAKNAEEFLEKMGSEIFNSPKLVQFSRASSRAELFSAEKLEEELQKTFKEINLSSISYPKIFVVAADCSYSRVAPYLFRNYPANQSNYNGTKEALVWQAARATSAAPMYFERYDYETPIDEVRSNYIIKEKQERNYNDTDMNAKLMQLKMKNIENNSKNILVQLKDGGLVANNPVQRALNEARKIWPGMRIDCIISIGTGTTADEKKTVTSRSDLSANVSDNLTEVIEVVTSSETTHDNFLKDNEHELFGYHRLSVPLPSPIGLSACSPDVIALMRKLADEYIKKNLQFIKNLAAILKKY